mmetsp:Transcript_7399/g.6670  ORF Transcript_7399/g.6670 Transcript_7399/m.6670 type:complete len:133 (-) Transcript_7399:18-416(-)
MAELDFDIKKVEEKKGPLQKLKFDKKIKRVKKVKKGKFKGVEIDFEIMEGLQKINLEEFLYAQEEKPQENTEEDWGTFEVKNFAQMGKSDGFLRKRSKFTSQIKKSIKEDDDMEETLVEGNKQLIQERDMHY